MFRKVMVPLDGSELAECALPYVKQMAKEGTAGSIVFLSVVSLAIPVVNIPAYDMPLDQGSYFQTFLQRTLDESRSYLDRVQSQFKSEGITADTVVLEGGKAAERITEFAHENGVDLIVMATHGYTGLKKMLIGSVAFAVLHEAHVPVLLIRPESCRA